MENKYSYEDDIRITSEFLNKIDIKKYADKDLTIYNLRHKLEDEYDYTPALNDDFFEGLLFNRMNEEEFMEYLKKRYDNNVKFKEITKTFVNFI